MTAARRADALTADVLEGLDELAALGDGTARHAAAVMRGRAAEHVKIDDSRLLTEVERLAREGRGRAAVGIVARRVGHTPEAIARVERRLRRKRKKNGHDGLSVSEGVIDGHHGREV